MEKRKALISVYEKNTIESLAACLIKNNIDILATGGSLKYLQGKNISVTDVTEYTLFPEMLDGRLKTLHPKLFGGILYKRDDANHMDTIDKHHIISIDFVVVNLYPFVKKQQEHLSDDELIEFIDIGGPSLLRAAAKNYRDVTVLTDIKDYSTVMSELTDFGCTTIETRKKLAAKVFNVTSAYDASIAQFLNEETFPSYYNSAFELKEILRYGENPHQQAAIYADITQPNNVNTWLQIQGKPLSYNNYRDIQAAISVVKEFENPVCCAVKHNTPCGVALGKDALDAYQKVYEADSVSIFGGIVAFNSIVNEELASLLNETFLEVIIAPEFSQSSKDIFSRKKNVRVLKIKNHIRSAKQMISIDGGLLVQTTDNMADYEIKPVTKKIPTAVQVDELVFAQKVVKHCTSNAIVISKNFITIGIGAGQTSRIRAVEQAINQAVKSNTDLSECVLASDAFFPFKDVIELCAENNISIIIQPGGSIKDQESIDACNQNNMTMVLTGIRHFKH